MAGPSQEVKLKYASQDKSHDVEETWLDLIRNFIICIVLGITVWAFCTGLKMSVEKSTEFLFEHLKYSESGGEHGSKGEKEPHGVVAGGGEGEGKKEEKSGDPEEKIVSKKIEVEDLDASWHVKVADLASLKSSQLSKSPEGKEKVEKTEGSEENKKSDIAGIWQKIKELPENPANAILVLFFVMFLGAVIRALLMTVPIWKSSEGDGATQSIEYFLRSYEKNDDAEAVASRYKKATFMEAVRRVFITALTLGAGGSGGLEGPVIPVGESVGAGWSKLFKVASADDLRCFQMAGIAGAVCTLLNTPFAAAIFAAEVVYSQRIVYRTLLYSMISVICAYALNNHFTSVETLFPPSPHTVTYQMKEYLEVIAVAIFCSAPAGLGLKAVFAVLKDLFSKVPFIARAPLGALGAAGIGLAMYKGLHIDITHVLGVGENTIHDLINNEGNPELKIWWVLILIVVAKTLTTGLTLMAGGSAGLLVPSMVLGGAAGASMFYFISGLELNILASTNPHLFIVSGISAALVAVVQVPVAAVLIVMEMFGANFGPPAMISVVVCHLLVKRLKGYQKTASASEGQENSKEGSESEKDE